jgi:MFS superfamily sulfate permease-like transporter
VPGTTYFADRSREQHESEPGVLVVRCESALVYFNAEYARERVLELLAARPDPIALVVFSLVAVPRIDLAGAEMLGSLIDDCRRRGVAFRLADVRGEVRDALHKTGFDRVHGALESGQHVDATIAAWREKATP